MNHPLREFLDAGDDSVSAFATRIGVDAGVLQRILDGEEWPEPALARRIVDATDGAVSFDGLYGGSGAVADLSVLKNAGDDALDPAALADVVRAELERLAGTDACHSWSREIGMATEAVANTYAALARVTTRRDRRDRVAQALRPVLEEILRDCAETEIAPTLLDQAVARMAALYCRATSGSPQR